MSSAFLTAILVTSVYPSCDPNATPFHGELLRPAEIVVYETPYYDPCSQHGLGLGGYPTYYQRHYRRPYNYRTIFDYPWHAEVYRATCSTHGVSIEVTNEEHAYSQQQIRSHRDVLMRRSGELTRVVSDPRIKRLGARGGR